MKPIKRFFTLNEIHSLVYDDKTKDCSFKYNGELIRGKLIAFLKDRKLLLIERDKNEN
jgi:hypothetical protein